MHNKQYKQQCRICGKYGHKPGDRRSPENKNEKEKNNKKTEKYECRNKKLAGVCYHCSQKGHMSKDCWAQKSGHNKKFEKVEKAIDRDKDDVVLCLLMSENKKESKKKKFGTHFFVQKNTWIGNSCASCHITNEDTGLHGISNIDESIKVSSSNMPTTKKGKL